MPRPRVPVSKKRVSTWLVVNQRQLQTADETADAVAEASESCKTPLEVSEWQSTASVLEDKGTGYEHGEGSELEGDDAVSETYDYDQDPDQSSNSSSLRGYNSSEIEYGHAYKMDYDRAVNSFFRILDQKKSDPSSSAMDQSETHDHEGSNVQGDHAEPKNKSDPGLSAMGQSETHDHEGSTVQGDHAEPKNKSDPGLSAMDQSETLDHEGSNVQVDHAETITHDQGPDDESDTSKGFSSSAAASGQMRHEEAQINRVVVPITSHVLNTLSGQPAAGMNVSLFKKNPDDDGWLLVNKGTTNSDGRLPGLTSPGSISPGVHMMRFETGEYFSDMKTPYPYVKVVFEVEANEHYHVPLFLSPYGFSTTTQL